MAEDKKAFMLYTDMIHVFESLKDNEAGRLIKHIMRYVNDQKPTGEDKITKIAFEPIKQQLKRDLVKYEKEKVNKSNSGTIGNLKRWHPDLYQMFVSGQKRLEELQIIAISRKVSHSDKTVAGFAVNDNVNDNVNDIVKKEQNDLLENSIFATSKYFNISEINNFATHKRICEGLSLIDKSEKLPYYRQQLDNYFSYKKTSKENTASVISWLFGDYTQQDIEKGHWCREDYKLKYENYGNDKTNKHFGGGPQSSVNANNTDFSRNQF